MSIEQKDPIINCPKCGVKMRKLGATACVVDRCESCFGIWLDAGERHKLMEAKHEVKLIDIGSTEVGREQNKIIDIACPRCGLPLVHSRHPTQRHIAYEVCPTCRGSFFDAGELADLGEKTVFERVRSLLGVQKR